MKSCSKEPLKVNTGKSNMRKGGLYALAFARIDKAVRAEFPVEAIALEESIIADRMRSLLEKIAPGVLSNKPLEVSALVSYLQVAYFHESTSPLHRVKAWLGKRNQAVHGIVAKRDGGEAKFAAEQFLANAMSAAREGKRLAYDLKLWVERKKTELKRADSNKVKKFGG